MQYNFKASKDQYTQVSLRQPCIFFQRQPNPKRQPASVVFWDLPNLFSMVRQSCSIVAATAARIFANGP